MKFYTRRNTEYYLFNYLSVIQTNICALILILILILSFWVGWGLEGMETFR
jgi:hypothetical protein